MIPVTFDRLATPPSSTRGCFNVARWQDSAQGGRGGWVTQVPDMTTNCFEVPELLDDA